MTHYYNEYDQDCFSCDNCDNEIRGTIYNHHGKPIKKTGYWYNADHLCANCLTQKED